jgi:hypothetical protein
VGLRRPICAPWQADFSYELMTIVLTACSGRSAAGSSYRAEMWIAAGGCYTVEPAARAGNPEDRSRLHSGRPACSIGAQLAARVTASHATLEALSPPVLAPWVS